MFDCGLGVKQDNPDAVRLYRLAAEQGQAIAQFSLGRMFDEGRGVEQDKTEAMRWYRLAAEKGDARAQVRLGDMLLHGTGVVVDQIEAMRLYQLAAAQGDKCGQSRMARYDSFVSHGPHPEITHPIEPAASVSSGCTIPPSTYHHVDSSFIFDSKNDENIIIRVSECNAENGVMPSPDDAPPQPPAKKKRGRPSYKSLLLNLELNKNTLPKRFGGK
jgi:TPR repeat protein